MGGESNGGNSGVCAGKRRLGGVGARRRWPLLSLCLLLAGCATRVPLEHLATPGPGSAATAMRLDDQRGPLSAASAAGDEALLGRHRAQIKDIMSAPLTVGNQAELLIDGPQTQQAMLEAIDQARHQIDLETYILESNGIGERLAALLEAKRAHGTTVRVLYDSVGSMATPKTYFDRLSAVGVAVCEFNPLNPLRVAQDSKLGINNRDHRKVLIVDQRIAFTGGINISGVYNSASFGRRRPAAPSLDAGWRDTHVAVRGPVVAQFQQLFDETWRSQRCSDEARTRARPPAPAASPERAGRMAMRLVAADPLIERSELYLALLSAIDNAHRRVWLTYGYFVPDERVMDALRDAARRGVDVRLALPGFSDFWAPFHAGRSRYGSLLDAGVRVFERRDALLHAKTAVIDGVWSSIGSTNLDWRSFVHNYEADLLVLDQRFASELERLFGLDESASHEITPSEWTQRGIGTRFLEWLARRLEYLL